MTLYVLTYFWRNPQHSDTISLGVFDTLHAAQSVMMLKYAIKATELHGNFYSATEDCEARIERTRNGGEYLDLWFIQEVQLNEPVKDEDEES